MSSRDDILKAVERNKPSGALLPEPESYSVPDGELTELFLAKVRQIAGEAFVVESDVLEAAIIKQIGPASLVAAGSGVVSGAVTLPESVDDPHDLAGLDAFVCRATLGVAETGAVWITDSQLGHRAAPFLAEHLIVVIPQRALVYTMHDAYARLTIDEEGFGLFIAGPSKTADIEQLLVIGAHGPKRHTVYVVRG